MTRKAIIDSLFYGGININGRRCIPTHSQKEIYRKIEQERQYFMELLPPEDRERFDRLEGLYTSAGTEEQRDSFACGLKLAMLLLCEVFMEKIELGE